MLGDFWEVCGTYWICSIRGLNSSTGGSTVSTSLTFVDADGERCRCRGCDGFRGSESKIDDTKKKAGYLIWSHEHFSQLTFCTFFLLLSYCRVCTTPFCSVYSVSLCGKTRPCPERRVGYKVLSIARLLLHMRFLDSFLPLIL